jgi:23S rRNA A2030 N6-methylase RlmJ
VSGNLLKVVQHDGNATISGTVTTYANVPYTFSAADTRQVSVQQYVVRITAAVEFMDNKKETAIYKGTITGEGVYNLQTENEQTGKTRAIQQLVQLILQNSVQGW